MAAKNQLTTEQMLAEGGASGKDPYFVNSIPELTFTDSEKIADRLAEITERAKKAFASEFYIEYLSLMLLYLEVWLRIFLHAKGRYAACDIKADKKTFGQLIADCEKAGMDADLIVELRFVNSTRISYVHKYLTAAHEYAGLVEHKPRLSVVPPRLVQYVLDEVALPLKNRAELSHPGQIVVFR
jgi:hypothetical protein